MIMNNSKQKKSLTMKVERSIYDKYEKYCLEMGQSKQVAAERILSGFLEAHKRHKK